MAKGSRASVLESRRLEKLSSLILQKRISGQALRRCDDISFRLGVDPVLTESILRIENYFRPRVLRVVEKMAFSILRFFKIDHSMTLGPLQVGISSLGSGSLSDGELLWAGLYKVKELSMERGISLEKFGIIYNGSPGYGVLLNKVYKKLS